ncbi:polyisoprenoid-binding protein YceI [Brevibacterium sanguinis]|uniref:Polyisoprenoid-binding protein YceI n=2 Tax=Brevibacterium TaxID=1696 RepID=A0A366IM78_9MICO|nr:MULTISPECIES: YceI family protein [Brevibacterium]RBP66320.1 polyisoprenoid-binding protein YceI [Brevibacterium sanguinis]RBP72971.1 polyisoprenoid-binding protein YceI [Brevibacterium celere]
MTALPQGLVAGTWTIDPIHSEFTFTARHAGVSKVRGHFEEISGTVTVGATLEESSVTAEAVVESISTRNEQRDGHLKTGDFFAADQFPTLNFTSTEVRPRSGDEFDLVGELTMRGVTKEVVFTTEFGGVATDPNGNLVAGLSAEASVNRKDFGMEFNAVLGGGELLVSDKIRIALELELIKG